jgi:hypothetical protein
MRDRIFAILRSLPFQRRLVLLDEHAEGGERLPVLDGELESVLCNGCGRNSRTKIEMFKLEFQKIIFVVFLCYLT